MNAKKITLLIATAVSVLATPALLAQMNMNMDGMDMGNNAPQHNSGAQTTPLPKPVQTVFTNYLKIQTALATNSLEGVSDSAAAIERAIRFDAGQTFTTGEVGSAAGDLANAANLDAARLVFKRLSGALIKYLDAHKEQAGQFEKVFCPMANAQWLQPAGSAVNNPYLGKDQASCGQIKN